MVVESARALIRLCAGIVKRLLKETASGASSNFNRHARGSILHAASTYQSSQLIRFCRIAPAVSLGSCSGSTSWSVLVLFGLQAMLLLSTNAELLTHQNYNNYN